MSYNADDTRPYLEQVASGHIPEPPVDDFNPAFAVMSDLGTVVQRQEAEAAKLPPVNRDRTPRVQVPAGSPAVEAAIRALQHNLITDDQRARLHALLV